MKKHRLVLNLSLSLLFFVGALVFGETLNHAVDTNNNDENDIMSIASKAGHNYPEFYRPKSSIVIDSASGQVLWSDNVDKPLPIASLTKLMTAYIILEEATKGTIDLDQSVTVSNDIEKIAQIYTLSNNKMIAGVEYTIHELLTLMLVPSSNAATVMLSDILYPDNRGAFIKRMNDTAEKLGMTNTSYYNASGASADSFEGLYIPEGYDLKGDNLSTARDQSILIYYLMNKHPEILNYTNQTNVTVKPGTQYEEHFESYVLSLEGSKYSLEGADGLKTGSSPSTAYGYGVTVKRDNNRLIQVLLGVGTWEEENGEDIRFPIGNTLLEKIFNEYKLRQVLSKGNHTINDRNIYLEEDLYALLKPDQEFSLEITDQGILVKSDLEVVSPKISSHPVAFKATEDKKQLVPTEMFSDKKHFLKEIKTNKLIPLIIGLIGLVFIVLSRIVVSFRVKRGKRGNLWTSLGIILGAGIIVLAIYLTLEQLLGSLFV